MQWIRRLLMRLSMRPTLRRVGLLVASIIAIAICCSTISEALLRIRDARRFPPVGRLVDIGGIRLHLDCRGSGSPTVVLESGLDHLGSLSWMAVHDSIARTTRVCAYSRAGFLWSDARAEPFDATRVPRDLHALLSVAGEQSPFVMVGHSLGGPYAMLFTARYPLDVAALVLIDASHPAQQPRLAAALGTPVSALMPSAVQMKVYVALAQIGVLRWTSLAKAPSGWPAPVRRAFTAFLPPSASALRDEILATASTLAAAGDSTSLGARPLVVLSAGAEASDATLAAQGHSRTQEAQRHAAWLALQADELTWSTRSRQEIVSDATHYIQFDRPDVVIRAVRGVVTQLRDSR